MSDEMSLKITNRFNKELYGAFVCENPNTSIFQTLDMAKVYTRNKNCTPLILVAINEDTGEIAASLLAKILAEKSGFLSAFSKHSTIRGGPIFRDSKEGILATAQLLQHYNEIVKKKALYSRIYPLCDTPQIVPAFADGGYEHGGWNNFLIDLNRSTDEIWRTIHKSRRKNINRAMKSDIEIEEMDEKSFIPIFYDLLRETHTKRKSLLEGISNFEATFDILVPKNMAKFFVARLGEEYLATRLVLTYRGVVYDWYAGSSKKFLSLYPNDLLVWHILKWGSENGFHTFDCGGGGTPDEISAGWVEFKRRFGGRLVSYGRYSKEHQPGKLWFSRKAFEFYRKIFL